MKIIQLRNAVYSAASLSLFLLLSGCGTGDEQDQIRNKMTGDMPGTGTMAHTGFEDASVPYNSPASTARNSTPVGRVTPVDSTEARGNSRWSGQSDGGPTTQPSTMQPQSGQSGTSGTVTDKTRGKRARYTLIGSKENNRSRMGQPMRADNPETPQEVVWNK